MCVSVCVWDAVVTHDPYRAGGALFDKIVITVISNKKKLQKKVSGHGIDVLVHPWAHKRILGQVGLLASLLS